jgi:competence protein ComEA
MPKSNRIYKAGKISFLLVCLFLCTACQEKKAVFEAGSEQISVITEEKINVVEEAEETSVKSEKGPPETEKVNINTADKTELMTLPGIGEVRAAAIVEHRNCYGDFQTIEDIMNVKGIKTGIFSKINSLICVK